MQTHKRKLPRVGQRILRSVAAVLLCFVIYFLRGKKGIPFYSAMAVLQCMQPYKDSSAKMAKKRTLGTLIGAFWGLVMICLEVYLMQGRLSGTFASYVLISVFIGVVIYSTVVFGFQNAAYFSCVVFLSITVMHITDESPLLFVFNRVVDTLIGVVLSLLVNQIHLPRKRRKEVLFVSGMNDTLLGPDDQLTSYSKIELNRMIEEGAKFTLSTMRTPASVREAMDGVDLRLPIIAMDGAVLYDMKENAFLKVCRLTVEQSRRVERILDAEGVNYFSNVIIDDLLIIHYKELKSDVERAIYRQTGKSPYRNYVKRSVPKDEPVVYYMTIQKRERAAEVFRALEEGLVLEDYKIRYYDSTDYPGYTYLKIYHKDARREAMLEELKARIGMEQTVTFGSIPGQSDIYIDDLDGNEMVKALKREFEPLYLTRK